MEISDSYIKIQSLKEEDEQGDKFNEKMDVIHDYKEKYKKLSVKDTKIAKDFYERW